MKTKNHEGEIINEWTILKLDPNRKDKVKRRQWLMKHKCGTIQSHYYHQLFMKDFIKCRKCWKDDHNYELLNKLNPRLWKTIKQSAENRGMELNITPEFIRELFNKQNKKCALTGEDITISSTHNDYEFNRIESCTASLDRIDSDKNYSEDNVQWVHKIINNMKQCIPEKEFIEWCCKVADHYRKTSNENQS